MLEATGTEVIRKASIEELAGHRARALELAGQAFDFLVAAEKALRLAAPSDHYRNITSREVCDHLRYDIKADRKPDYLELVRKEVDRAVWRHLLESTHLTTLMDTRAREQFYEQVEKEPPPATAENAAATMFALVGDADKIFRRGLVEAFRSLDNSYKSNDAFKIGKRAVMYGGPDSWGQWRYYSRASERIMDVERVLCVLDGKPQLTRESGIVGAVNAEIRARDHKETGGTAKTDYFFCRWFKNGNVHLYFLREDLVKRANQIIAEHYGETLADAT
jgi:hypothetical protein